MPLYLKGVILNIPAGLWGKKQYTVDEVLQSRQISIARIHVERAIKYIKDFKILKHQVPRRIVPYLSQIFYVCSHLCNLQPVKMREIDEMVEELNLSNEGPVV